MIDADRFSHIGTRKPLTEVCAAMGIKTYDTSLPQDFWDVLHELHPNINSYGHIVWSYDVFRFVGSPVAVDEIGAFLLKDYYSIPLPR